MVISEAVSDKTHSSIKLKMDGCTELALSILLALPDRVADIK